MAACPTAREFLPHCSCPFSEPVIQTRECTYYTGSGILANRGVVYWSPLVRGPHCVEAVMHAIERNRVSRHNFTVMRFAFVSIQDAVVLLKNSKNNHNLLSCLLQIQRAVRAFLRLRREAKHLAVAMGLHPRLGVLSGLNCLCQDVMQQVTVRARP